MEGVSSYIPESILVTIVFPKIIHAFITEGPGECYQGLRNSGCSMCHISTRVCGMLMRCLPRCREPKCKNPAIHKCAGNQPICCVHAARFGYMHQHMPGGGCLCQHKKPDFDPIKNWSFGDFHKSVSFREFREKFYVSFWNSGILRKQYNLTDGKCKSDMFYLFIHDDLLETEPETFIFLLYHYMIEIDRHIFKRKNPGLARNWKKMRYEENF